jgi:hypothetical protein
MFDNNSYSNNNLLRDTLRATNQKKKVALISDITKFHIDNRNSLLSKLEALKKNIENINIEIDKNQQNYLSSEQILVIDKIESFLEKTSKSNFDLNPSDNSKLERDIEKLYLELLNLISNCYSKIIDKNKLLKEKYISNSKSLDSKLNDYKNFVIKKFSDSEVEHIELFRNHIGNVLLLSSSTFINKDIVNFYEGLFELNSYVQSNINILKSKILELTIADSLNINSQSDLLLSNVEDDGYLGLQKFIYDLFTIKNVINKDNIDLFGKYNALIEEYFLVSKDSFENSNSKSSEKTYHFYKEIYSIYRKILKYYYIIITSEQIIQLQQKFNNKLLKLRNIDNTISYSKEDINLILERSFKLNPVIVSFSRLLSPLFSNYFKEDSRYIRSLLSEYESIFIPFSSIENILNIILNKTDKDMKNKICNSIHLSLKQKHKELKVDVLNYIAGIFKKEKKIPLEIVCSFAFIEIEKYLLDNSINGQINIVDKLKKLITKYNKLSTSLDIVRFYFLNKIIENISKPIDIINEKTNRIHSFKDENWKNDYTPEKAEKLREQYAYEINKKDNIIKDITIKIEFTEAIKNSYKKAIDEKYKSFVQI